MEFLLNERCIFVFVFIFCTIHNHWMFAANVDDKNFNKILTISEFDHYDSEIELNNSIKLAQPLGLKADCREHVATLSWAPSLNKSIEFIIYQRFNELPMPIWKKLEFRSPLKDLTKLVVQPLFPNSNYSFMLQTMFSGHTSSGLNKIFSENSTIVSCVTKKSVPIRNPEVLFAYKNIQQKQITVLWQPLQKYEMGGNDFLYVVSYWPIEQPELISTHFTNDTVFKIDNINLNQIYNIKIESKNMFGLSYKHAQPISANSTELKPTGVPEQFEAHVIDGQSVLFKWLPVSIKKINGNFQGYNITIEHFNNRTNFSILVKPDLLEYPINLLKPLTKYRAKIAVQNSLFTGNFSQWIEFSTFQYILPSKPTIITSFYCRETIHHIEHKIDLIMQSKDNNITYAFNVCIRPLYEKVDMNSYCESIKQHSPEDIEEYRPGHLNKIEVLVTELDAEIWMSAVAINGSVASESDVKKTIKTKNEWEEICKTNTFTSTTVTTTSTTTTTEMNDANLLNVNFQEAQFKDHEYLNGSENINLNEIQDITMFDVNKNKHSPTKFMATNTENEEKMPFIYIILIGLLIGLIGVVSFLTYYYRHNIFGKKSATQHLRVNSANKPNSFQNEYIIHRTPSTGPTPNLTESEIAADIYLEISPHENEADISNRLLSAMNEDTVSPYNRS